MTRFDSLSVVILLLVEKKKQISPLKQSYPIMLLLAVVEPLVKLKSCSLVAFQTQSNSWVLKDISNKATRNCYIKLLFAVRIKLCLRWFLLLFVLFSEGDINSQLQLQYCKWNGDLASTQDWAVSFKISLFCNWVDSFPTSHVVPS